MNRFVIDLRTLTPAFIRGARQDQPELRPASFKGQLRWWYRAWNPAAWQPGSPWAEGRIMGGTRHAEGRCPFTLRLHPLKSVTTLSWRSIATAARTTRPNGLRYLGFSFDLNAKGTTEPPYAIAPGTRFRALHLFPREPTPEVVHSLLAAWWLLAHLGGVGARARRGFGSLVLEGWRWDENASAAKALASLPLAWEADSRGAWADRLLQGLNVLQRWLPGSGAWPSYAPRLGPGSQVVLGAGSWTAWTDAMHDAGRTLSAGRKARRGRRGPLDDRVTFGLPLETGRKRKRSWLPDSFRREPIDSNRQASPLHLSIGAWREGVGQVWSLLAGPRPGIEPYRVREDRNEGQGHGNARDAVAAFVDSIQGDRWKAHRAASGGGGHRIPVD